MDYDEKLVLEICEKYGIETTKNINIKEFLLQNGKETQYALVEYDERIIPIYFVKEYDRNYIPYICQPFVKKILKNNADINKTLTNSANKEHTRNMIVNNFLYEISWSLFKTFLPVTDDIILITERECLLYLLELESAKSLRTKRDSKENLRKGLIDSGEFDADTTDMILDVFNNTVTNYSFKKK